MTLRFVTGFAGAIAGMVVSCGGSSSHPLFEGTGRDSGGPGADASTGGAPTGGGGTASGGGGGGASAGGSAQPDGSFGPDGSGRVDSSASGGATFGDGGGAAGGAATDGGDGGGCPPPGCACPVSCVCESRSGRRYAFCSGSASWVDARATCEGIGSRLARIDDAEENGWLVSRAGADGIAVSSSAGPWMGANDLRSEATWEWTDGTQFWDDTVNFGAGRAVGGLFQNWRTAPPPLPSEPSNSGAPFGSEDCGQLLGDGTWNDAVCNGTNGFICEDY